MENYSWDPRKAAANEEKHGVRFEEAQAAFRDPLAVERVDNRWDYGEERRVLIGQAGEKTLSVCYTQRGDTKHLISARLASREERARRLAGESQGQPPAHSPSLSRFQQRMKDHLMHSQNAGASELRRVDSRRPQPPERDRDR